MIGKDNPHGVKRCVWFKWGAQIPWFMSCLDLRSIRIPQCFGPVGWPMLPTCTFPCTTRTFLKLFTVLFYNYHTTGYTGGGGQSVTHTQTHCVFGNFWSSQHMYAHTHTVDSALQTILDLVFNIGTCLYIKLLKWSGDFLTGTVNCTSVVQICIFFVCLFLASCQHVMGIPALLSDWDISCLSRKTSKLGGGQEWMAT